MFLNKFYDSRDHNTVFYVCFCSSLVCDAFVALFDFFLFGRLNVIMMVCQMIIYLSAIIGNRMNARTCAYPLFVHIFLNAIYTPACIYKRSDETLIWLEVYVVDSNAMKDAIVYGFEIVGLMYEFIAINNILALFKYVNDTSIRKDISAPPPHYVPSEEYNNVCNIEIVDGDTYRDCR